MSSPNVDEALVRCGTTKGDITLQLIREWSPNGYDRALELFERHFYDDSHFFRAVPNFLVQFGISYSDDEELQRFSKESIPDDPQLDPRIEFESGTISFAGSGPNSRTSQLFFSYKTNPGLGQSPWETPIGKVIEGMEFAEQFYSYGDMPPWGNGPVQGKIYNGPQYIESNFPMIDKFLECTVERNGNAEDDGDAGANADVDPDADADADVDLDAVVVEDAEEDAEINSKDDDETANAVANADHDDTPQEMIDVPEIDHKTQFPSDHMENGNDDGDNFLVSKSERKLIRMRRQTDEQDDQTFVFAGIVIFIVIILVASVRSRNKVVSKMN